MAPLPPPPPPRRSSTPPPPPPPPVAEGRCFTHPDRLTGRSCTRCGRPACPECLTQAAVGSHCWQCVAAAAPARVEQLRRWNATAGPVATTALVAINIGVFVWGLVSGGDMFGASSLQIRGAVHGPAVADGEWYRLLTAGFLHYGLLHLGFNMFVIYQLGSIVEPALGRIRFLALYLAALLAGSAGALLLDPNAYTAGASGAAFGLAGAVFIGFRQRGLDVWRSGIGTMLVINLLITFTVPGISIGGHVGGLLAGGAVGGVMLRPRARRHELGTGSLAGDVGVAVMVMAIALGVAYAATRQFV